MSVPPINRKIIDRTQERLDNLTKPLGSLGRLEELAKQISGITGIELPSLRNKVIFTFAADHGVTEEKISAYPKEVTAQMVYNFLRGGAAINVLARHAGARVVVADLGVCVDLEPSENLLTKKIGYGTRNIASGPAMTRDEALRAIKAGQEIFEEELKNGIDICAIGEMGIGNTTSASAIVAAFTGRKVEEITGRGAGIDDAGFKNKVRVIEKALSVNKPDRSNPIDVLSKLGGFEIGGLCGVILAASSKKIPVVIDGFISTSAALIAYGLEPGIKNYLIASHCSQEIGHRVELDYIGLKPILDLDLRLGEGTGAALALLIIEASVKILSEMATFASAGVSKKDK